MQRKKLNLINTIILLFVFPVILLSSIYLAIQINSFNSSYRKQSLLIQSDYTEEQKAMVKREVSWVYDYVNSRLEVLEAQVGETVRKRTLEAHDIAENIYNNNKEDLSDREIAELIKDALRPINYAEGMGYFFINSYSGVVILLADRPELEGSNLIDIQDRYGNYVSREMIAISKKFGEGMYKYLWTKPGVEGNDHRKISYVKYFEPYDWIIGTGLYLEDEEQNLETSLLTEISNIRFGQEGYIFVNSLDGDALVSNGEMMSGDQKLWEIFDGNPGKTKDLFRKELEAAQKSDGDFIYYTIRKLRDEEAESPKTSFIKGIPRLNWLIGAGVYLDDVNMEIARLRDISYKELRKDIIETVIITLSLIFLFTFFYVLVGKRLQRDFNSFAGFFSSSLDDDKSIDEKKLKFVEFIELAEKANKMQREKIIALDKLKDSENRFRLLAENSKDMIFKMSIADGSYEYISPASTSVTGYTPQEIMKEPYHIRKAIHPDWTEWLEETLANLARGHIEEVFEYQLISKSGEEKWISQSNTLIKDETGRPITLIGRLSDDTRRKKAEEELNRSARMDAIGKLAGGVAHDFNNVLAGIMNAANVLKSPRREIDDKGRKMADLILKAAARAADLTARLSAFGGKRTLLFKAIDIHHIIKETEVILGRTIDKQIEIVPSLNAQNPCIVGDGTEIQSIILNLSINASHAIEGAGKISITTTNRDLDRQFCEESSFQCSPGLFFELQIADTGCGIDHSILKRIFEPFFTTKEKGKGTGLGLATVYRSVIDHNGLIDVESEPGKGTVFTILLPCSIHKPEEVEKRSEEESTGTGHILLIDDEEFIREAGRSMLEELGYSVQTASNGLEGVNIFKKSPEDFDVVIVDVVMPIMGGLDAFFEIKEIRRDCPVIMISGHSRKEDLDPIRNAGLEIFIRKPFDDMELSDAITKALS